jgi:hypothetical protein
MSLKIHQIPFVERQIRIGYGPKTLPSAAPKEQQNTERVVMKEEPILPKTTRQDSPKEKGAIGSHGENAPAQKKVPQGSGNKEKRERDNG